jgi:TRAP-type C4-dicarboxylate transport system permease small subunit
MILSTFILISFLVPIAAFIAIPGAISVFIAIVFSYVNNEELKLYRVLQIMNYKYPFKISTFACLVIVPAAIILGIGMYTYSNVSISPENILKISPSVVYLIIATTMFTLAWGVSFFSANCFALQNDASMISVCTDAIEQVIKFSGNRLRGPAPVCTLATCP